MFSAFDSDCGRLQAFSRTVMVNEKLLRTTWTGARTVRCTKGRTEHDIAHITTSTTAHCTTSSDITTRRHGVSPRFHNFDSFCLRPLQSADRLAQSGVATKLRFRFESLRCVLTWVGDAWRRAVGHILTWVGYAWRSADVAAWIARQRNCLMRLQIESCRDNEFSQNDCIGSIFSPVQEWNP